MYIYMYVSILGPCGYTRTRGYIRTRGYTRTRGYGYGYGLGTHFAYGYGYGSGKLNSRLPVFTRLYPYCLIC